MGEVYRARDTRLGRDVAVKVLPRSVAAEPERLDRFEREMRLASVLSDPHIVTVLDAGNEGDVPYLVTELIEGETLREVLNAQSLSLRRILDLAGQVASGLAAAHAHGIVHRDVKPDNILISRTGIVRITDFGLAKLEESFDPGPGTASTDPTGTRALTDEGAILGTIGYMSPEQILGERADARSDIFSFGCVLYEMATGRRAFEGKRPIERMMAILRDDAPPIRSRNPQLPDSLERIVEHCLEKNAEQRFQSAHDIVFALQEVPIPDSPAEVPKREAGFFSAARLAGVLSAGLSLLRAFLLTVS